MKRRTTVLVAVFFASACAREDAGVFAPPAAPQAELRTAMPEEKAAVEADVAVGGAALPGRGAKKKSLMFRSAASEVQKRAVDGAEDAPPAPAPEAPPGPARSWFPETFLFAPTVTTDDRGEARLGVRVPDRLTTWRILALAHDRQGGQGGAVTRFDSALPTYIDPVLPDALVAGDRVALPVLMVNTTEAQVRRSLTVVASGAAIARVSTPVTLMPNRSEVRYVPINVQTPGTLELEFSLGASDRVKKSVPVDPPGRPMRHQLTGALAGSVTVDQPLASGARPESVQAGLTVYPGALALLKNELLSAGYRRGLSETAYAVRLSGTARSLIERLGGRVDPAVLRRLRLRSAQRLLVAARSPDPASALLIAQGAGAHGDDPLLSRLADRMARRIASLQRPDGTFTGGDGWPLQRVVVATAAGVDALAAVADDPDARRRLRGAKIRAEGAIERYIEAVQDPYTAAAILAAGFVRGSLAERLRARVRAALEGDDAVRLPVPRAIVRVDGTRPTVIHATALATLALLDDPESKGRLAGLGNTLLGAYRPGVGWGDGATNIIGLEAATALFADPLPARVTVELFNGETRVAQTVIEGPQKNERHEVRVWVPRAVGEAKWHIRATPAVPGLAYALALDYRVPWPSAPQAGLTLTSERGDGAQVGKPEVVTLTVDAPGGVAVRLRYALPAGVQPLRSDLAQLKDDNRITAWSIDARGIELTVPRRAPGTAAKIPLRLVPTFAGRLQADASYVELLGRPETRVDVASDTWVIAQGG